MSTNKMYMSKIDISFIVGIETKFPVYTLLISWRKQGTSINFVLNQSKVIFTQIKYLPI